MKGYFYIVLVSVFIAIQGAPLQQEDEIQKLFQGSWDKFQREISENLAKGGFPDIRLSGVRDLKPIKGGRVYGESQYTIRSSMDVNGQKSEQNQGHKVVNDDGNVKEYDFVPTGGPEDFFKDFNLKLPSSFQQS